MNKIAFYKVASIKRISCNASPVLFLLLVLLFLVPWHVQAQKKVPDRSVAHLYQTSHQDVDYKIFREHIQLDGDSVAYIPFRKDSLYGFVDKKTKKWVIEPKFTQVFACYKEGAIVELKDKKKGSEGYGLVAYSGKFLIPPVFPNLFKEDGLYRGIFNASDTSMQSSYSSYVINIYYDEQGKFIFDTKAHKFKTFVANDSLAWFRYGEHYEIYNRKGKLVKGFPYNTATRFCGIFDNVLVEATRKEDGLSLYVGKNINGKTMFEILYDNGAQEVYRLSEAVFAFIEENNITLTNAKGETFPYGIWNEWPNPSFAGAFPYLRDMELIPVRHKETEKVGYINKRGELVISCKYDYAGNFEQGEAPYLDSGKYAIGFMNVQEENTVPAVISEEMLRQLALENQTLRFSENLCKVHVNIPQKDANGNLYFQSEEHGNGLKHNVAYVDRAGNRKIVLPDSIILGGDFTDGLAPVVGKNGGLGFIDTSGKIVIPMKYEIAVAGAYPLPYLVIPKFKNGFVYLKAFKGYLDKKGYEYFSGKQVKDKYDFSH